MKRESIIVLFDLLPAMIWSVIYSLDDKHDKKLVIKQNNFTERIDIIDWENSTQRTK